MDGGDGAWQRLEEVARHDHGATVTIPPGGPNRRLAVGMPVTPIDLHRLLDQAQAHPAAQVRRLGFAGRGSPVWGMTIGEGSDAQGTVIIQALQHGSEWAGLRVLSALVDHLLSPAGDDLRRRWRWCCYPATNADSLYQGWRGDVMEVDNGNHNRDWGVFALPETKAVADDIKTQLQGSPPLRQVIDLHMGWNFRRNPGSAVGVPADDGRGFPVLRAVHWGDLEPAAFGFLADSVSRAF